MIKERKTILIVLGQGGHTKQMLKLVDMLGSRYDYEYAIPSDDKISENKIKYIGRIFRIIDPRKMSDGLFKAFFKYIPSSIQSIGLLFKSKSNTIIASGPAFSAHICLLGKLLFRKKIIFLESWSRVYSRSMAGKFVYPFSDLFFIQWPQEKENYKKAIYAGRLG